MYIYMLSFNNNIICTVAPSRPRVLPSAPSRGADAPTGRSKTCITSRGGRQYVPGCGGAVDFHAPLSAPFIMRSMWSEDHGARPAPSPDTTMTAIVVCPAGSLGPASPSLNVAATPSGKLMGRRPRLAFLANQTWFRNTARKQFTVSMELRRRWRFAGLVCRHVLGACAAYI